MAISVGDAVLKLGVDTKDLDKGMQGIGNTIKKHQKAIGLGMAAAGGAILAAGALSIKTFAEMGDEVAKMARKTGISTVTLSELRQAAELSGTSLEGLEKATKRMATSIGDAKSGLAETVRDFDKLGISVEELEGLSPEDAFIKLGLAIGGIVDPIERAEVAQGIFGRAGMDLIPMFDQGVEGLNEMRQSAHDLGIVFDEEAARAAEEMTDALHDLGVSTSGIKMIIAKQLIPILIPLIEKVTGVVKGLIAWVKENPKLTKVIVIGTTAFGALLVAMGTFLLISPGIIAAGPLIGAAFHTALGPIGLITLAIAGLVAAGIALYKNWDKVQLFLQKVWTNIKLYFLEGISNILESLGKFTSFIPVLGDKIAEVRNQISGMIEAEEVKKDLLEVEQALEDTTEIIAENIEETDELTVALEENRQELELQYEQLEDQIEAYEKLSDSVEETRRQFDYERSEAGKLRISIDDVTFALFDLGWSNERVTETFEELGDEADNVNAYLEAVGLTAAEVAAYLDAQKESVDALTGAYQELGKAPTKPGEAPRGDENDISSAAYKLAEEHAMTPGAAQDTIDRYAADPGSEEFDAVRDIMEDVVGFQHGGIAMRPMLANIAEKKPEAVIPLDRLEGMMAGSVSITGNNFYIREEADIDKVGESLVRKIRQRTGLRI